MNASNIMIQVLSHLEVSPGENNMWFLKISFPKVYGKNSKTFSFLHSVKEVLTCEGESAENNVELTVYIFCG